jgi:hypothetical protein
MYTVFTHYSLFTTVFPYLFLGLPKIYLLTVEVFSFLKKLTFKKLLLPPIWPSVKKKANYLTIYATQRR